jgi:hypothetical protein
MLRNRPALEITKGLVPTRSKGLAPDRIYRLKSRAISFVQYGSSLTFQAFSDFLGILRVDSNFFQGGAESA